MGAGKMIASLAAIATKEVQKNGIFTFPGLCRIKTRQKPATKACKKEIFGKMQMVKARPARTIVKAFPVAALKERLRFHSCIASVKCPWISADLIAKHVARLR